MSLDAIRTMVRQAGTTDAQLGAALGVTRVTVNRWLNGASGMLPMHEYAITHYLTRLLPKAPDLGRRHRRNLLVPVAVSAQKCPECRGALIFPYAKGVRRRGVRSLLYPARCKRHLMDLSACPVTTIYFDKSGGRITAVPKFAPREFKELPYDRPTCPHRDCGLQMISMTKGTVRARTSVVSHKGELREEKVDGFLCTGGRWGKQKHKSVRVYCDRKGNPVSVLRGSGWKLSDLPITLRRNYPHCDKCGRPMPRQTTHTIRTGKRIWRFRCCGKNRSFDDSGREHQPYDFGQETYTCHACGARLKKTKGAKAFPKFQAYFCPDSANAHKYKKVYRSPRNGRWYVPEGSGSKRELKPLPSWRTAAD